MYLINIHIQESKSIGEPGSLFPACNDDNRVASANKSASFSKVDSVLDASINVLQPIRNAGLCVDKKKI